MSRFKTTDDLSQKAEELKNKVFSIKEDGQRPIRKNFQGGYNLEEDAGTTIYFNKDAKDFLKRSIYFKKETQIIIPRDGEVRVTANGKALSCSDSGAVLIREGTHDRVEVLKGNPIVVTIDKVPEWYKRLTPDGEHRSVSESLTNINKNLLMGHILKEKFTGEQLNKLFSVKLIENVNERYVKFIKLENRESVKEFDEALNLLDFSNDEIDRIRDLWWRSYQKKFYSKESGEIRSDSLSQDTLDKLVKAKMAVEFKPGSGRYFWKGYYSDYEFRHKIWHEALIQDPKENENCIKEFVTSSRSGYDNTGLVWETGNISVYSLKHKANMWSQENTEWIVNSTAYASKGDPFVIGTSTVKSTKEFSEPTPFNDIRKGEVLHCHPIKDGEKKQVEIYVVTNGKAALLTMQNGRPRINVLRPYDIAVIHPGVSHRVMAIEGKYEHVVFQAPSTFQYGMGFKQERNYNEFGTSYEECLNKALDGIKLDKNVERLSREQLKSSLLRPRRHEGNREI